MQRSSVEYKGVEVEVEVEVEVKMRGVKEGIESRGEWRRIK